MKHIRTCVDTSVFGGVFDEKFTKTSSTFFGKANSTQFSIVTSAVVPTEIMDAPQKVRDFFNEILPFAEIVEIKEEAIKLRDAYLEAGIVSNSYSNDALHVA